MLSEFGIIPDVFRTSSYSHPDVCELHLKNLKRVLLDRGLVRNFRDGGWERYFREHSADWDAGAKELVKNLALQKRLAKAPAAGVAAPSKDCEWCDEAVASHQVSRLDGIITSRATAEQVNGAAPVSAIEKLDQCDWWTTDQQSVYIPRRIEDYRSNLEPILTRANFLMFMDPYLDPSQARYSDFSTLLKLARRPDACQPRIEIHRQCVSGGGIERRVLPTSDWKDRFSSLNTALRKLGLSAEVFLWDDFHDRFLITDLVGILMGNGFDTSRDPNERTTWSRINRKTREEVQSEFDQNSDRHYLRDRFFLGTKALEA